MLHSPPDKDICFCETIVPWTGMESMNVDYTKFDQKNHVDGSRIRLSVQNGEVASQTPSLLNILLIFQKYFFTICFVFSPVKESLKLLSSHGQKCILGKNFKIAFTKIAMIILPCHVETEYAWIHPS